MPDRWNKTRKVVVDEAGTAAEFGDEGVRRAGGALSVGFDEEHERVRDHPASLRALGVSGRDEVVADEQ